MQSKIHFCLLQDKQGNLVLMDSIADAIKWPFAVSDIRFLVAISCHANFLEPVSCWFLIDCLVNFRSLAGTALARSQLSPTFGYLID